MKTPKPKTGVGYASLWKTLSNSYAEFIFIPRVLAHEMPDTWQLEMAALLEEYHSEFPNLPKMKVSVDQLVEEVSPSDPKSTVFNKVPLPRWLRDFNLPNMEAISIVRRKK